MVLGVVCPAGPALASATTCPVVLWPHDDLLSGMSLQDKYWAGSNDCLAQG